LSVKITGPAHGSIDEKRLYLPGITVTDKCPKCGKKATEDLESEYLSYPTAGVPFDLGLVCRDEKCSTEWSVRVKLVIRLVAVGKKSKAGVDEEE
jgi:hypothetical protein